MALNQPLPLFHIIHNLQLASLPGKIGALGPNAQPPVVWVQNLEPGLVARQFLGAMTLVQEVLLRQEIAQLLSVLVSLTTNIKKSFVRIP